MSRAADREEFMNIIGREGIRADVGRALMRAAASLQTLAERECSDEAADRDRVPCPAERGYACICEHWKSLDSARGCGCTSASGDEGRHHPVTRIAVREQQIRRTVDALCARHGLTPVYNGDPRGAVLKVKVPSGRTNDMGREGVCVP